jgi:hypothetical protein
MCFPGQFGVGRVCEHGRERLTRGKPGCPPSLFFGHGDELLIRFRVVVVDIKGITTANHCRLDVEQVGMFGDLNSFANFKIFRCAVEAAERLCWAFVGT